MKFCPKCGRSCSEHARFCINCGYCFDASGAPLRAPEYTQAPQSAPMPQRPAAPQYPPQPATAPPYPPQQPVMAPQQPVIPPQQPQMPQRPPVPQSDLSQVETASSDLYALHQNDGYDPTTTSTTTSGSRMTPNGPEQRTDGGSDTPKMSKGLWNGLLFGAIGLSVILLIAATVFYLNNRWI